MFACIVRELRCVNVTKFPYAIYYRILGDTVVVVAVIHVRRDPQQFKSLE